MAGISPAALRRRWSIAPDGKPRADAPFGQGPVAARVLARVIDGAAWAGSRIPGRLRRAMATAGGHVEWLARPGVRATLANNLAHAVGASPGSREVRRAVRREMVNEAHRSADLLWAMGKPLELFDRVEVVGDEHAKEILTGGRGVILAGVHLGGWEVAAAVPGAVLPAPTSVIVADNWLAWAIQHRRAAVGLRMIYRQQAALAATRVLRRGEVVLILGEDAQGAEPRRHLVRFCDSAAWLPAGVVSLARLGRASITPFGVVPLGPGQWRVVVEEGIDPPVDEADEAAVLQRVADRWTAMIRAHPAHWAARFPIDWASPA